MSIANSVLTGYENTKLIHYQDIPNQFSNVIDYEDLPHIKIQGVLKSNQIIDGRLKQIYSIKDNHVGVIAATRLGKTSQYVIPTILSFARAMNKRCMIISDPKGELYRITSETLRKYGYKVLLVSFRDAMHSEYWNPLTPIFHMYVRAYNLESEVKIIQTKKGRRKEIKEFQGKLYEDQAELDIAVERMKMIAMEDVANEIDKLASMIIPTLNTRDPYWEDSARDFLKAGIWAMLEDIYPTNDQRTTITEETFSFSTLMSIIDCSTSYEEGEYFATREKTSRSYRLAKNCILENAPNTRKCVVSTFNSRLSIYKNSAVRLITSCNSFKMEELTNEDQPIAVYIDYPDESKAHYQVISLFIQNIYNHLIQYADKQKEGKLKNPFYLILDEFGNFPMIKDFETVISACGGRNIYFILILQSYAQLNNVYGKNTAEIIKDNLNMHVFIGSNNPDTLSEFSRECGEVTRISPLSALNGSSSEIDRYEKETIPLMPKSTLSNLQIGECIVTEANCGYVLYSKMERYYLCDVFSHLPSSSQNDYYSEISPLDKKYIYVEKPREKPKERPRFNFDFD